YNARVRHTDDGGRTWLPTPAPCVKKGDPDPGPRLLSFISPTVGWLLCGGSSVGTAQQKQLFKTEDGGRQWTLLASSTYDESRGLPSRERARSLFFLDDQHGWLGTLDCCLYATNDGGRSWQPLRVFGGPVW